MGNVTFDTLEVIISELDIERGEVYVWGKYLPIGDVQPGDVLGVPIPAGKYRILKAGERATRRIS